MKKILLATSALFFLSSTLYAADISGSYKCTGKDANPAGGNYALDLVIAKNGNTYSFGWKAGETEYSGTGIFSPSAPDVVAVEFSNPTSSIRTGVMVYQAKADGTLDGIWAFANKGELGSETCVKQK